MDKILQKAILKIIDENSGTAELGLINIRLRSIDGWGMGGKENLSKYDAITNHQLHLLVEEEKVVRGERPAGLFIATVYTLTPKGHRTLGSWWEKAEYFVLYDRHNLFVLLALVISVVSLIVSIFK